MLILASSSPRRIQILKQLGINFRVFEPPWETRIVSDDPVEVVRYTALEKARSVAGFFTEGLVVAADTIVVIDGEILGKPRSSEEAKSFLKKLSGRTHEVITGLAIIDAATNKERVDHEVSRVKFKELTEDEISLYIMSGEPFDKAGGYGIQGLAALFIEKIEGDYYNVVGLPIRKLYEMLKEFGYDILRKAVQNKLKSQK
ncbi:MAG: Maf family protein [Candidatus Njordarchaeales archaeon]